MMVTQSLMHHAGLKGSQLPCKIRPFFRFITL